MARKDASSPSFEAVAGFGDGHYPCRDQRLRGGVEDCKTQERDQEFAPRKFGTLPPHALVSSYR